MCPARSRSIVPRSAAAKVRKECLPICMATYDPANSSACGLEGLRYRHRHEEADEHQGQKQQADRNGLRIQFVGGPGRVVPRPVHREEHYQGLQDAGPRQVLEQEVGDLRDREHEHEIVEELEGRGPLARPIRQSSPYIPHGSSLTTFGTFCPCRDSQSPNARRATPVFRVVQLLRICEQPFVSAPVRYKCQYDEQMTPLRCQESPPG